MYQKLETRLMLYEKDHPIKDDHELIAAIESILDEQDSLPIEERDFDLIAEATNTILKLQGYDENHLNKMASEAALSVRTRIADKRKGTSNGQLQSKRHHILRWVIPLVAIIAITTVAVLASPMNRLAISEMTNRIFSSIKPEVIYHEDNTDLEITDTVTTYTSFKELSAAYNYDLLLPFDIEDELQDLLIETAVLLQSTETIISFTQNRFLCSIIINHLNTNAEESYDYNAKIGAYNVVLSECNEYYLAEWKYNQERYQVKSESLSILEFIIISMRLKDE